MKKHSRIVLLFFFFVLLFLQCNNYVQYCLALLKMCLSFFFARSILWLSNCMAHLCISFCYPVSLLGAEVTILATQTGVHARPIQQNVRPDESVMCVKFHGPQVNRPREIPTNWKSSHYLEPPKSQKSLKLRVRRSHTHKICTKTCGSVSQTWIWALSLKSITVSKKSPKNKTNKRQTFPVCLLGALAGQAQKWE